MLERLEVERFDSPLLQELHGALESAGQEPSKRIRKLLQQKSGTRQDRS